MSTTHTKTQRRCPTCGELLLLRHDMNRSEAGQDRTDIMLVCRNEACAQPARHLSTRRQPA
ncbi:hypothetical protein GII33_08820 [Gordonia pseudamarae]|jgi:hypothetical protein|uniref:Uncharacterized protein n=1 Tax=Gordonia pseudamarae TaxID=2831662 RepID=A0ABX6IGI8_9ACTN|nr:MULTISPECIES: hypothetical protein [Gordonia]MBD0023505.1 hypothetical protein [Gordonia sp. (in: high G+C Gram-positive bacteria)]QHN26047.1 hypothetical protein GII33_08820 [Gordonia pseudamarae]QHN34972.1 hypothetical protein GII31_08760 [Gordonia pseudamarae]